ncbi:tRNA (guanine-N(7)-)-methyltransferase [Aliidongia dinghuensis]|uniref:tRNA (guanine-N(7)-)-methyltransferase n=1 Tax=Aliidongia dinghuensis TaxID=1867774 RepID=A0A8J2YPV8_9PROT|nr:tRNA (guanosine(46)-N7)-methyltransferase TrmB [Aliidongia dinghuensis]GGE99647.1 tRNA (guanine-N(7)-)-methyltransferase [Aliidongia dinghuensis]
MTETTDAAPPRRDRLHGRRRGHKLRAAQQRLLDEALPQLKLSMDELAAKGPAGIFPKPPRAVWLEIGFGGGEHLAAQAANNPDIGLIGCEVFENGIVQMLGHVTRDSSTNIRVATEDARRVLDILPPASLDRVFILFPDPWRKTRHHKRRLVQAETLDRLAELMADGAELRLATDHVDYLRWMLARATDHPAFEWLARGPADWRERPEDWPQTRYEAKAIAQGRRPAFLRLKRRPRI